MTACELVAVKDLTCVHLAVNPVCAMSSEVMGSTPSAGGRYDFNEHDHFEIHCSVEYFGHLTPTVQCRPHAGDHHTNETSTNIFYVQRIRALYNMTGTEFHCAVTFQERKLNRSCQGSNKIAANTPTFNQSISSFVIEVLRKYG
jgi:hypothetical protein